MPTTYCTAAHVEFVLSEAGVTARVDDDESGVASVEEEAAITTAIAWAASEINSCVGKQYKISEVTGNTSLQMANAYMAAERLCARRGNQTPESLTAQCDKIREKLNEIRWGREQLPEQPDSFEFIPTVSNFVPVLGAANGTVFFDRRTSTKSDPADGVSPHVSGVELGVVPMSTTRCIVSADRLQDVERFVMALPRILSGQEADPFGIVPAMHARLGYTFLALVQTAYEVKGRGGTDDAGESWAPLSAKYLAYKRPVTGRKPPKAGKFAPGAVKNGKRPDGYLSKAQLQQWNRIYGGTLKRLMSRFPLDEAKNIAAGRAWNILKARGPAKTKLGTFAARVAGQDYQILVDTGALRRSLQPGTVGAAVSGVYTPPNSNQVFQSEARRVVIGSRLKYAGYHHYGKGLRERRLWPRLFPSDWWRQILGAVRQGCLHYGELFGGRTI